MITSAPESSLLTNHYLKNSQPLGKVSYSQSQRLEQKENFQFNSDQVSFSYSAESITTYNRSMAIEGAINDGYELLRGMVLQVFEDQGIDSTIDTGGSEVDMNQLTQEGAQELIAEDGYFGVNKTSERIFKFAIGIAGGDPSRLDAIRGGVEKGFQEALDAFGGWLPDISYDTYDAVMTKLDDWAAINNGREVQT